MKTKNTGANRPKKGIATSVQNHETATINPKGVTQEEAFASLLIFFRCEVGECKALKGVPSDVVNRIAHCIFCATVTDGWYEPEMPSGFKNPKKEILAAMDRAKAGVFTVHFQRQFTPVPDDDDKQVVSALLKIRERMEDEYREETGICPHCGRIHSEDEHGKGVA